MARVAIVTGGTRGIGAAISTALKEAGYQVAATYGGNDEAANKFKAGVSSGVVTSTGVASFCRNVSCHVSRTKPVGPLQSGHASTR